MRDKQALFAALEKAMTERLDDPKNVAKGDFPTDMMEIYKLVSAEYYEFVESVGRGYKNDEHQRWELADLACCVAFALLAHEKGGV